MNDMQSKDNNKKSNCPNNKKHLPVPAEITADIVGCSVSYVKQVRNHFRASTSPKGRTIMVAETLLKEGSNALIEEVKRMVKL